MKFLLNGNDWEADCFISTAEDNNLAIRPNTIRLSIGTEHLDDIIEDLENGFAAV